MTRTKNDIIKPLQKIDISVTEILIAGDGDLKPYIQTFHYEPENIALQPLGSILGIFEIEDRSEDSAYIVNFLASVVKKEYFSHPKRAAIESLEATLHKINLALSELIKQDNTAWLGKLNATLCVFEKNNVHFSVSGKAKTLLIRDGVFSDISDGLAEESNIHPLKTFTEVSSGRLKTADKIILTTPGLFELFSPEELQKSARRFSNEKFSQFLKTALINQLLFGSTLIVDISEASIKKPILKKADEVYREQEDIPNVFSQSAFSDKKFQPSGTARPNESSRQQETIPQQDPNYTDSKTGHIYVQGDIPEVQTNETWIHIQWFIEEAFEKFMRGAKKIRARSLKNIQDLFTKKSPPEPSGAENDKPILYEEEPIESYAETAIASPKKDFPPILSKTQRILLDCRKHAQHFIITINERTGIIRRIKPALLLCKRFFTKIFPHFSAVQSEFARLSTKQKRYAIIALFSIFIIPFIIIKFQEKPKAPIPPIEETAPVAAPNPLSGDKNIHTVSSVQSVLVNNNVVTAILLKGTLFAVTKNSVINLTNPQNTQVFALPETLGTVITKATAMNDLNTIFLLTNTGKIISFTPSNHIFTDNTISLPDPSHITDIATYLTYLYILDSENKTIYRYPRATGGFGESATWLKDKIDLQSTDTMAINEDVYVAQNDQLLAFNKGKQDPIAFEKSATPIVFSKVFTQTNTQFLYVLDTVNGRLIQFEKSGTIVNQYAHSKIKEASATTVDEKSKKAYFTTPSEVFSISLE
jgi:hypothetical protein